MIQVIRAGVNTINGKLIQNENIEYEKEFETRDEFLEFKRLESERIRNKYSDKTEINFTFKEK